MSARIVLLATLLGLLMTTHPYAAELPDGVKEVVSIEGFTEYKLENGYRILLFPDASQPVVTVNNTIFVGSRHEGYGEAGMAHLLEHMLFKGTPDHPEVPKVLQERGARFNGTTWLDRTNYYETLPASEENLEFAIRLEADRMVNSFVRREDLDSEMTVVRNEFERGENSPSRVLQQKIMSAAFEWHNYGQSTIGNRADIERVPIDKLKAFYKKYYRPDNAMLIVSGKFDPESALKFAAKYFGSLKVPDVELPKDYTEEPAQDGERFVTLKRVGEVPLVGLAYHIPSGGHPDYVPIDVLESILTMSPNGRLYKSLVGTQKASAVNGSAFALHDPGVIRFTATVTKGNTPQLILDTITDEIAEVREKGVTDEEVERAKTRLLKQFELILADSKNLNLQMSEWQAMGDWRLFFLYRDRVETVTAEDVKRVANAYLQTNNRTVGFFVPTEKPVRVTVPPTPDLAEMIGDYKGRELVEDGEDFDTTPANIQQRTTVAKTSTGIDVALLPKKTRGNIVNLRLVLRFGNVENLQGQSANAEFLGTLMSRGTKNLSRQQIQDLQDKLRATVSVSSSPGAVVVSVKTKRESLPEVLDLVRQILREPTFPQEELDIVKSAQLTGLRQQLNDPQTLAFNWVSRKLNPYEPGDPRYTETPQEEIEAVEAVTVDSLKKMHSEFLGGSHGQLAIVGDFDPENVMPEVEKVLANWKASQEYARQPRITATGEGGKELINTPDKENAVYFAAEVLEMQDSHEDYPALTLGNFILGAGALSSRLGDRVRQKEGLSYGVASFFNASSFDKRASLNIYAITNPMNAEKVHKVIREEIDLLLEKGISEEELKTAKEGYLQQLQVSRANDASLASTWTTFLNADRSMTYQAELEAKIGALTVEDVNSALKKWIEPERLYVGIAGDWSKAKSTEESE